MPTPTSAYNIILTSFAPSPMERVVSFGSLSLTIFTISAFYFGDTRQANTTSVFNVICKNVSFRSFLSAIKVNEAPAIIIAVFLLF